MAKLKKVRTVGRNAAALTVAKLVNSALTLLLAIAINRQLGPANAGIYNLALAVYMMLGLIPDFGIGYITIRDCSQDRSHLPDYLPKVVAIRTTIALGVLAALTIGNIGGFFASSGPDAAVRFWTIAAINLSLLVEMPLTNTMSEALVSVDQFSFIALVYMNMSVVKIGISAAVLAVGIGSGTKLVLLMLAYVASQAYGAGHMYLHYRRKGFNRPAPARTATPATAEPAAEDGIAVARSGPASGESLKRYLLRSAWPMAVVFVSLATYSLIDIPILFFIKGDTQVGLYSAAYMFARSFLFLVTTLNLVVLPIVARAYSSSPQSLGRLWEQLMRYGVILIVPLALIIPLLGRPILILQQHDFVSAMPVLWITMAAAVFFSLSAIMYPVFVTIESQRKLTLLVLAGVGVKVVLNLALVPFLGYKGTATAMLASEIILFFLLYFSLSRRIGHRIRPWHFAGVPAICAAAVYAGLFALKPSLLTGTGTAPSLAHSVVVALGLSVAVLAFYVAVMFASRQVSRSSLREFEGLLQRGMEPQAAEGQDVDTGAPTS